MSEILEEIKKVVKSFLKKTYKYVLVITILFVLVAGMFYYITIDYGSYEEGDKSNTPYQMEQYTNNVSIDHSGNITQNKSIQELWDEMIKNGCIVDEYLAGPEELQKLINAQLATYYLDTRDNPDEEIDWTELNKDINSNTVQGIIKLKRANTDGTSSTLVYTDPATFQTYIDDYKESPSEENKQRVLKYFTLEQETKVSGNGNGNTGIIDGKGNGSFKKYNLTEEQLQSLANVCKNEQGTAKGAAAEASLMANRFELKGSNFGTGGDGLCNYVRNSGWFANASGGMDGDFGVADSEIVEVVRAVLVEGKRTIPGYVDEHDYVGDIAYVTNNGESFSIDDRTQYVQHVTKINNIYSGKYTFYSFPDTNSDPFGYTSEENRLAIGDFYYDFDTGEEVNKPDSSSDTEKSLKNILFIGDSIASGLKSILEDKGAIVLNQGGENAGFFLGKNPASFDNAGICQKGEYFDWNGRVANLTKPNAICLILGQNLSAGGDVWIRDGVEDIKELVSKLKNEFPGTSVYINSVLPVAKNYTHLTSYMNGRETLVELLKDYCSTTDGVFYIDTMDGYVDYEGYAKGELTGSDGLHPNSSGVNILAQNIKKMMPASSNSSNEDNTNTIDGGLLKWPTDGTTITSYFGNRNNPTASGNEYHEGIDIGVDTGTNVYAAESGTVTYSAEHQTGGKMVFIDHGNGYVTKYMHNSELKVSVGDIVNKGQVIALSGSTGRSTGPHLDFRIEFNGVAQDPLSFKYDNGQGNGTNGIGSSTSSTENTFYARVATWNETIDIVESNDPTVESYSRANYEMTTTKINYREFVSQYDMPFDYLWALLVISQDKEFVFELADLVFNSEIEITVHDNLSVNTNVSQLNYTKKMKVVTDSVVVKVDYNGEHSEYESGGPFQGEEATNFTTTHTVITKTNTLKIALTKANVWVVNYKQEYTYQDPETKVSTSEIVYNDEQYPAYSKVDWNDYMGFAESFRQRVLEIHSPYGATNATILSFATYYYNKTVNKVENITNTLENSRYISSPGITEEKTDNEAEENNFVKILIYHTKARRYIDCVPSWLFEILENSPRTIDMIDLTKYLLYKTTGRDYGVTELDFSAFDPKNFINVSGLGYSFTGSDTIVWRNNYSKEAFVEYIQNYIPPANVHADGYSNQYGWNLFYGPHAEDWFDICTSHGLDPIPILSWSINESGWGTSYYARTRGNLWGWAAYDSNPDNASSGVGSTPDEKAMNLLEEICSELEETINDTGHWRNSLAIANGYTGTDFDTLEAISYWYCSGAVTWQESATILMKRIFEDFISENCVGGDIISCAKMIHEYMEQNNYTYCVYYCNSYEECGKYGKSCGLDTTFEKSQTGHHNTCCATYVSWVLQEAGYMTESEHSNSADGVANVLKGRGWTEVSISEAQAGDILYYPNEHIEIYAGNGTVYNAGSGSVIRGASPHAKTIPTRARVLRAPN